MALTQAGEARQARWLSEDEAMAWRTFLAMRRALDRGVDRQLMQSSGLSIADYQLLVPLSEVDGQAMRARDLGREVDWERSRLSHQIRRMEQRGLLERRECPTDARGTIIALTELGRETVREVAPSHVDWVREHFVDVLSQDELQLLRQISERIIAAVQDDGCQETAANCCGEVARGPEGC